MLLVDCEFINGQREIVEVTERLAAEAGKGLPLEKFHSIYIIDREERVFPLHPAEGCHWDN